MANGNPKGYDLCSIGYMHINFSTWMSPICRSLKNKQLSYAQILLIHQALSYHTCIY